MAEDSRKDRDGEERPDPRATKINRLNSPVTNEEILLFDEIEDEAPNEVKNSAKSSADIRRQSSIASGRRRWYCVRPISNFDLRRDRRNRQRTLSFLRASRK